MTTTQEINAQLYRPIQSGVQYDGFFPKSSCTNTPLANGDTKVAIKEMAKWAIKYADHCKDVAPILEGDDLEHTVDNIQDFLYQHIQYAIDGEDQNLKSPACAWQTRNIGTDCKSYSIFASCILLKLGIKHYLRRIKQEAMPDAYTHVYVVIPINQDTANLKDGYFIIDGTIQYNNEVPFLQNDDIFMNEPKLGIFGLAAQLGCASDCNCGDHNDYKGGMSLAGYVQEVMGTNTPSDVNFVTKIQTTLTCINSTFTPKKVADQVNGFHIPFVENLINAVYASNSVLAIQTALNALEKYMANANQFFWDERTIGNDWEKCSRQALDIYTEYYRTEYPKIQNIVVGDLSKFFSVTSVEKMKTTDIPTTYDKQSGPKGQSMKYRQYQVSGDVTAWLQSGTSSGGFTGSVSGNGGIDLGDFVPDLGGGGTTDNYGNDQGNLDNYNNSSKQAGFGYLPMVVLAVAGFGYYMSTKKKTK